VGAALAPPVISYLALQYGWRSAFFVTALLGMVWVVPWWFVYRSPEFVAVGGHVADRTQTEWQRWQLLLTERETWYLTLLRLLTDPVWYFYLFWFPKYLSDARHLTLRQLGSVAWVVYLAADLGSILAGLAVSRLIGRGGLPIRTEQRVMTALACMVPAGLLIPFVTSLPVALALAGVVAFAQLGWQIVTTTLAVNYFGPRVIATAFGIIAAGSGLGGLLSTDVIGRVVTNLSYQPVFIGLAFLHPIALLLLWRVRVNRAAVFSNEKPVLLGKET
jgi:ACS family hexuronate transporter-like MFS transporter